MSMCRCCGQPIEATAATTPSIARTKAVRVDNAVLALCNQAYEDAARRGSAEVSIAQLAVTLAALPEGIKCLNGLGLNPSAIARAAEDWLRRWDQRGAAGATVKTSAELKTLLAQAEARALRDGRDFADIADVARALLEDAAALWSASFTADLLKGGLTKTSVATSHAKVPTQGGERSVGGRGDAWPLDADRTRSQEAQTLGTPSVRSALPDPVPPTAAKLPSGRQMQVRASVQDQNFATASSERAGEQAALLRAIAQRLEHQDRQVSQRLDMQQRMLAELAEAFAHAMREAFRPHDVAAPAVQSSVATGQRVFQPSQGEFTGAASSRAARRSSFRRQSWSRWRQSHRSRVSRFDTEDFSVWQPRGEDAGRTWSYPDPESHTRTLQAVRVPQSAPARDAEPDVGETEAEGREKRFYLAPGDHIEKAPSIGARTAAQLESAGIRTVRDLLSCDPADVAARMTVRYITAERIALWQAQSRLVCTVPWLRGTHAQLLVGAGYDTIGKIVAADTASICAAVLKFAATRDGQSILRASSPPDMDWVEKRVEHARSAEPERAAA